MKFFYDQTMFRRRDAYPRPLANTQFGKGAVHVHDGEAHLHRKAMFLRLLSPQHAVSIGEITDELWARRGRPLGAGAAGSCCSTRPSG